MEKLLLPLHLVVWGCLFLIFILLGVIVVLVEFLTPQKRAFVFGSRTKHPYINAINVFLGGCVPATPKRNFARFVLMLWFIMCLVVRTSYQGALFDLLKGQRNASAIDTIPEILKAGFKLYGVDGLSDYISRMDFYKSHFVPVDAKDMPGYRLKATHSQFKGAIISTTFNLAYINEQYAKQHIHFYRSKDNFFNFLSVILVRRHSYLKGVFDEQLQKFIECGLIERWAANYTNPHHMTNPKEAKAPTALTMDQLGGIFIAYAILLLCSFLVFTLEVLSRKSRFLRRLFNFLN